MRTFDITGDGPLGVARVTPSNVEKHWADFRYLLDKGVILNTVTVTVTGTPGSTITGAALSMDHKRALWFVNASATAEEFKATLTVTTNDGQTLVYSIGYVIG